MAKFISRDKCHEKNELFLSFECLLNIVDKAYILFIFIVFCLDLWTFDMPLYVRLYISNEEEEEKNSMKATIWISNIHRRLK